MIAPVSDRATFAAFRTAAGGRCGPVRARFVPGEGVRLAFALPRRVGNAVVRNRIRRRLRAAFTELLFDSPPPAPGAYLVAADSSAATLPYAQLRADLGNAVGRAGRGRT